MPTWSLRAQDVSALVSAVTSDVPANLVCLGAAGTACGGAVPASEAINGALRAPRAPGTVKSCLFPAKQLVASYPHVTDAPASANAAARRAVLGVRACELRALEYLDRVFGHAPVADPFYQDARQEHVLISVDCVEPHETCFCTLVGGMPFVESGSDVNLTPIDGAYVVEVGSAAGAAVLDRARDLLHEASDEELARRQAVRDEAVSRLQKINGNGAAAPFEPVPPDVERNEKWARLGETCVECGACTHICPTCHCFYLFDRAAGDARFNRLRAWDSCVWSGYSRMAGADRMKPNPRSRFRSRFANRFLHKYAWSPEQWDMLGCVGCGRCVEACPGRIDIREVIREVSAWSQSVHTSR